LLTRKRSPVQTLSRPPHIFAAQAGSKDPASWFSRLTPGRRAANGQQREPTGGQTVRYRRSQSGDCWAAAACLGGQGRRPAPARVGDSNSTARVSSIRGQGAVGGATCGFDERLVTPLARRCPPFAVRPRTEHGPTGLGSLVLHDQPSRAVCTRSRTSSSPMAAASSGRSWIVPLLVLSSGWRAVKPPSRPCWKP
jgi:hypothetical protein